jgi:hypothetical protein
VRKDDKPPQGIELSAADLEARWRELAGGDAAVAYRAVCTLARSPRQTVVFLRDHLRSVAAADHDRVTRLLADLDSNEFSARDQAGRELERLGESAEPALRTALQQQLSPEVRRRVGQLLEKLESNTKLPAVRAIEVLERIATPEARQLLDVLAKGAPGARLTGEAKSALERLNRRATAR